MCLQITVDMAKYATKLISLPVVCLCSRPAKWNREEQNFVSLRLFQRGSDPQIFKIVPVVADDKEQATQSLWNCIDSFGLWLGHS